MTLRRARRGWQAVELAAATWQKGSPGNHFRWLVDAATEMIHAPRRRLSSSQSTQASGRIGSLQADPRRRSASPGSAPARRPGMAQAPVVARHEPPAEYGEEGNRKGEQCREPKQVLVRTERCLAEPLDPRTSEEFPTAVRARRPRASRWGRALGTAMRSLQITSPNAATSRTHRGTRDPLHRATGRP